MRLEKPIRSLICKVVRMIVPLSLDAVSRTPIRPSICEVVMKTDGMSFMLDSALVD